MHWRVFLHTELFFCGLSLWDQSFLQESLIIWAGECHVKITIWRLGLLLLPKKTEITIRSSIQIKYHQLFSYFSLFLFPRRWEIWVSKILIHFAVSYKQKGTCFRVTILIATQHSPTEQVQNFSVVQFGPRIYSSKSTLNYLT